MDKGKIKNLILNNKIRSGIVLMLLIISILLVSIISFATTDEVYVVEIKDDGSENIAENFESSVTKKIISETTKSLTYEVAINNIKPRSSNPEVAIVIDTSNSMTINDIETQIKPKAIEFIQGLLTNVSGVRISISNNSAVKAGLGTSSIANYTNIINAIAAGEGSNLNNGITNAVSTFSSTENEKYLVIFSDATDSILENLQINTENGINVYSILTDMTNNEYTQNQTAIGNVQMISDIESFSPIYNTINNSIVNVKVTDIFTEETNNYFKFEEGIKDNGIEFTKTENGYELQCENIKAGETRKIQFTLTLDESSEIDSGRTYRDLNTSEKMTIEYDNCTGDAQNYEMENSPIYVICKKYSLSIEAVSEKSDKLPVKDLDIKVTGTIVKGQDEEGNDIIETIYEEVLKTDDKGKIKIDELKTLGDIKFEIKPYVNQFGYSETDATTIIVHNDPKGPGIWAESDVTEPEVDVVTRNINVKLPIKTQTYELKVETVDSSNSNIKLGGIEYRLIQPKLNSKYEMEALYATTDENGNLTFRPSVMTKDGKYEYVLSQLNEQEGYDSIGNVTLYVTFKDGDVTEFTHKYNDNVETQYINEAEEKVIVKNDSEISDTFRLEINVTDSENNDKKIEGAIYNIEVTRVASSGQQVTNTVNGCITNVEGKIELDLPGTGNVRVRIIEVNPATGYHVDTKVKEIVFSRTEGRVQLITAKDPIDLNAIADSDANALVVNLTSIERSGKNRIQIHMIDNDERDINIPGVALTLVNLVNNKTYTAVSDGNGIANFLVDDEEPGMYAYDIMLTNGLPYGYLNAENKLGGISVHFDDQRFIDECSDTSATVPYFSANYQLMEEEYAYHTGKVDIGLTPDAANAYNFQVKLVNDKNKAIQGAKYDILIESGNIVRTIKGRQTDANGMLTTKIIGKDEVKITVKETETIKKHIINTQEQIIELAKVNGQYQITHQEPYQYNGNDQKIGAEISGKNVIYHDINKEKTGNDTLLNLYINKIDTNNNLVGGVRTVLTSQTLKLAGNAITPETNYSATAKSGNVFTLNPAVSDNNGYFEVEGIQVNAGELNNGERVDYLYMYEIDSNGNKISNTDITLKLTFRYNVNKEIVQITNVEATWGNRLISKRNFDGYETNIAYESNVYLDIYTNYDDVGNFSLDLVKTDKDNNKLQGAKYDVVVTRLDGTRVIRRGIEVTDLVEFDGFLVAEGTKIEITEVQAPIGYEINQYTEILTVKTVDPTTGKVTVQLENSVYATPRAKLEPLQDLILPNGMTKTCAIVKLTDYELDTFKLGIKAEQTNTNTPVPGYSFKISTSQGAQRNTKPTDNQGKTSTLIGANYKIDDFKVVYTIDTAKAADYYKELSTPIQVAIIFDLNGDIKTKETIKENEANKSTNGYGTIWSIEATNTPNGNNIDIKVNVELQEKLIVNIISQDRRTNGTVVGNEYKIQPCLNMTGIGQTRIEVGYVAPDSTRTYTIEQITRNEKYAKLENQTFKIEYDLDGNIKAVSDLSNHIISETHNGKEVTLTIVLEPTILVNIVSQDRRTKATISDATYEIKASSDAEIKSTGKNQIEIGYAKPNGESIYTITQINEAGNYGILEDQTFKVKYDQNDNIIAVTDLSSCIISETHNGGQLTLTVVLEPVVTINIKSQDRISKAIVTDNEYKITPSDSRVNATGTTQINVGFAIPGGEQTYTITQTNDTGKYEILENQTFKIKYDEDDKVVDVTDLSDKIIAHTFTDGEVTLTLELEPLLPVTVNIVSKDIITGTILNNVQYKLEPSRRLEAVGSTQIIFGYAKPLETVEYTLKQTSETDEYVKSEDLKFQLEYDNDDIIINANSLSQQYLTITSFNERILNIEVMLEPAVPFVISNIGYFDNAKLSNAKFEITSATPITKLATTDVSGIGKAYVDKLGTNETIVYKIKQTEAARTYCTVEEFEIEVTYDANRYIVDAKVRSGSTVNKFVTFVTVTHTNPSTTGDIGYNGNDRGIVNLEIKNYPAVQFEITNVNRQDNTQILNGTSYKVTSSTQEEGTGTTNQTAIIYVGRGGFSSTITYTINETSPAARYQKQLIDSVIEVDFDNQGIIKAARIIKNAEITTVTLPGTSNYIDSLKVNVQIQSNPKLAVNITKIDEETNAPLANVDFEVVAKIEKKNLQNYDEEKLNKIMQDTTILTDEQYLEEVFDRIKIVKEDIEAIKQEIGLNKVIENLKANNNLTAEEEDQIMQGISYIQKANKLASTGKVTLTEITQTVNEVTNQEVVDKLIAEGKTTQDTINDILAQLKDLVRLDANRVTTNQSGIAIAYMDKTLENKTIEYTLKETRKANGYDWPDEPIIFKVTYDETGKMVQDNPIEVVSGNIEITGFDINNFSIETLVKNTPSKEIKIHVRAEDTYDSNKKLETAKYDAYLVDPNAVNSMGQLTFAPDSNYMTALETGSVQSSGVTAHGEDIESIGIYKGQAGTRILRLVEKQTPGTYYIGNQAKSTAYKSTPYAMLIRVTFNDEGRITEASIYNPGGNSRTIGYIADSRYLTVSYSMNTIEVTVKYYPMIKLQMVTKDMYTNRALQASYSISTSTWETGYTGQNRIQSGYINPEWFTVGKFGADYGIGYTTDASLDTISGNITTLYNSAVVALAPTEADNVPGINVDERERIFYIYENSEPTSPIQYQKYRNWHLTHNSQRLIATIKVTYDEIGMLKTAELIGERSNNNITKGFVEVNMNIDDGYTIQITVKYAPITTISAKVVDGVTGAGISGIRIDPYQNNTNVSNYPYEYRPFNRYYVTGSSGNTGWTYWGGSIEDGKVEYRLSTSNYYSNMTGGYFNPGQVILEVSYDGNGRVSAVDVKSTDQFGDPNAININWTNNNINITIPYARQFLINTSKVDYYDSTHKLGGSRFRVESSAGVIREMSGNYNGPFVEVGKVYPGKTVRYTFTEIQVPAGYTSIGTLYVDVTFNNDGTIRSTTSSHPDYYEFVNRVSLKNNISSAMRINIKNKPSFNVNINLSDKFYPTLKLEGVIFDIINSKGDNIQGGVTTDKNGIIQAVVGQSYRNEEVTYTIRQKSVANGYYMNNGEIQFKVRFNQIGEVQSYTLMTGNDIATIHPTKHLNSRAIDVNIVNMPKDVKIGVYKYNQLDEKPMSNVKFNVKTEVYGRIDKDTTIVTNENGNVVDIVDTFTETNNYKVVKYTISEIEVPNSFRKIQDVVIQVTYNQDGSMYIKDVLSNPSGVGVEIATNKQIKYVDNIPVHIKLTIPNDNAYDLIIKNEDKNYPGLGIANTQYDVTINGQKIGTNPTNSNGLITIPNRTEVGQIEIQITEKTVGEGYREDNNNNATIIVNKGEGEYSLKLDPTNGNSNPTYATVVVDEEHGTVAVTFKNETKLELNVVKDDINTGALLEGAIFAITSEEIDNRGNTIAGTLKTITNTKLVEETDDEGNINEYYQIDEEEKTNKDGLIYFDLGTSYQNKTIKYTLNEVVTPEGYTQIVPINVIVKFDAYGRITQITDDSFRADCYLASHTGESRNMIFNISNGTVDPQYTIKVISADSQTGTRINGSLFQIEVKDNEGATYKEVTGTTKDILRTVGNRTFVSEKGVMKVTGIKAEGDITIALNQVETATGYIYGSNKVSGNIIVNAQFIVSASELQKDVKLTQVNNDGFEVSIDNTNREITIKVKNDPELEFDITKINGKTQEKLSGAEFTVTSVMQTSATTTPTTLNETSKLTDENGHTKLKGGMILAGRTLIYTLRENKLEGYNKLDDIILLVQYDTKGNIMYYEILSDMNDVKIMENEEAFITETKRILGETDVPGIVDVEYQTYQVPTGLKTKKLQLQVTNTPESANDDDTYQIKIEKHHIDDEEYPYFIPGVTFEITVKQEYGKAETTWVDITNENGVIVSPSFNGYGYITVEIKELETVEGFKVDHTTKTLKFLRDKETHNLELISLDPINIGYEFSQDNKLVTLKPVNEIATNMYNMIINKVDKNSNLVIKNNPANIEVYRIDPYKTLTPVENEETGEITYETSVQELKKLLIDQETDVNGIIAANNLFAPEEEGTYRYVIKETKAPEGYIQLKENIELEVTFEKNEADELIITNAVVVKGNENLIVLKVKEQLLSLAILNTNENNVVQDGNYALDITKVDKDKNAITTDTAIFKLTDVQTNEVAYYETNDQGRLEIPSFEMPKTEGKYIYKLNEIKAPEGYILNVNDIMIELEFTKDDEGKMYLKNVNIDGDNIEYTAPEEGELPDKIVSIKVINEEGGSGTGNTNDKRYTFVLNKVDSQTKEIITQNVEFEVVLVNGEIVKGKTNDKGQLRIEDVFMPARPGEYELVIKEKTTPNGYKVDNEMKVVKVTFTGYGDNMVISNIELGDTNNKNIEILKDKCGEQYIEVNILNELEDPILYVISRKYQGTDNDIYDVLQGYTGSHYKIDKPFIDTKLARYGGEQAVTVQEFIDNLESNGHMVVLDKNGQELPPTARVGTGMTLQSTLGKQKLTFTIVVKGDASGDARVTTVDLNMMTRHLVEDKVITDPIVLRALDLNREGRITTVDLNKMYEVQTTGIQKN